jgi:hypothetical protein
MSVLISSSFLYKAWGVLDFDTQRPGHLPISLDNLKKEPMTQHGKQRAI